MRARSALFFVAALGILLTPSLAHAKPTISRTHHEFAIQVGDCGIGVLELSIDTFTVSQLTPLPSGDVLGTLTVTERGTALDPSTGATYSLLDRFTQSILIPGSDASQPFVVTGERTFVLNGAPTGGILARGVVHMTILPSGEVVSDPSIQFVRCL